MPLRRHIKLAGLCGVIAIGSLTGCATPFTVAGPSAHLTWIGYINGADLRANCSPGSPDRFRLIRTGPKLGVISAFDVSERPDGALVEARAIAAADLAQRKADAPLADWAGPHSATHLSIPQFALLTGRLAAGGAFAHSGARGSHRGGDRLWLVSGCHAGSYFQAVVGGAVDPLEAVADRQQRQAEGQS